MTVEERVAERVEAIVERARAAGGGFGERSPELDLERLERLIQEKLQRYLDPEQVVFDRGRLDPDLLAAVIAAQLLPCTVSPKSGVVRHLTFEVVAKRVARSLSIPRSALAPSLALSVEDVPE